MSDWSQGVMLVVHLGNTLLGMPGIVAFSADALYSLQTSISKSIVCKCQCRCYIQWTDHWDSSGMEAVATSSLQPVMQGGSKDALDLHKHIQQMLAVHNSRCTVGATPRHYVAFVNLCGSLYSKKRSQLLEQQDFLKVLAPCFFLITIVMKWNAGCNQVLLYAAPCPFTMAEAKGKFEFTVQTPPHECSNCCNHLEGR